MCVGGPAAVGPAPPYAPRNAHRQRFSGRLLEAGVAAGVTSERPIGDVVSKTDRPLPDLAPLPDLSRRPDPARTGVRAAVIFVLLLISVAGMCYTGWLLYHLPPGPPGK